MLESTISGAIVGGLFRLAPEVLKYVDRHLERRHELAMQDRQLEFCRIQGPGRMDKALEVEGGQVLAGMELLREAWTQQMKTGDPKLDRVSILVRPGVTYVLVALYVAAKVVMIGAAIAGSQPVSTAYTADDLAFLSGITTFWFLGRPLEKRAA